MRLRIVTAGSGADWEATLAQACRRPHGRVEIVQRCYDLAELLAVSAAGAAQVALVAEGLRWLDRDAVAALGRAGIGVVAVTAPGDHNAERRLRQLGVAHIASTEEGPDRLLALAETAASGPVPDSPAPGTGGSQAGTGGSQARIEWRQDGPALGDGEPAGSLITVWGPKGAPGRTTVAVNLAVEAARLGVPTLLADADTYGGSVAQLLGLLDDCPGLAWAARLTGRGELDAARLRREACRIAADGPHVLVGLARPELWTELSPVVWEHLLGTFRRAFPLTVLDVASCLEEDEELLYDQQVRFRRNGVARLALQQAGTVVAVTRADPLGLHDFIRGFRALQALGVAADQIRVVVNQYRGGLFGGDGPTQIRAALLRYVGIEPAAFVPYDRSAIDAATLASQALAEACPSSPVRRVLADLAGSILGLPATPVRRRPRRRARPQGGAGGKALGSVPVTPPAAVMER